MSKTSCLIMYYTGSKLMRGVVYPDYDAEIADPSKLLRPGESGLVVKYADLPTHPLMPRHHAENCRIHLANQVGQPAHKGRCALVPKGIKPTPESPYLIEKVIIADPEVDTLLDHDLHLHPLASPGWTFDGTNFIAPKT
jgi:hypothetical protein